MSPPSPSRRRVSGTRPAKHAATRKAGGYAGPPRGSASQSGRGDPGAGRARGGGWRAPRDRYRRAGRAPAWEPDARAWRRWRRGQSRHPTLIFDLATTRCFGARCPSAPSLSRDSGVSRSGARGDELLSAPPGSPALLLLPPSLRLSSGLWSRRPRATAGGGAGRGGAPRHKRRQARAPAARTRRPGPGHLAKRAAARRWAREQGLAASH